MKVLVIGGTRFFGVHLVHSLLGKGHDVTIATRGKTNDAFGEKIQRIVIERTEPSSLALALKDRFFDVVCDNIAYTSNDVKYLLDTLKCKRYIITSSSAVYIKRHLGMLEGEFNPLKYNLKWSYRLEYSYDESKRQAECALFQKYSQFQAVAVRFPFVIGEDDYTKRLYFYIEQVIKENSMNIDNIDEQLGFIKSTVAGDFLSWIAEQDYKGTINANNIGTISLREIVDYVEKKTSKKAIISNEGLKGPYNGQNSFNLDVSLAKQLGYEFADLKEWIYDLLDTYIEKALKQ